jgi:hypothetical protein
VGGSALVGAVFVFGFAAGAGAALVVFHGARVLLVARAALALLALLLALLALALLALALLALALLALALLALALLALLALALLLALLVAIAVLIFAAAALFVAVAFVLIHDEKTPVVSSRSFGRTAVAKPQSYRLGIRRGHGAVKRLLCRAASPGGHAC